MSNERLRPTGKQIRKALIDLDIRVVDLAREMGVTPYYIREIYAERRKGVEMRGRIAEFLREKYKAYGYRIPGWAKEKRDE